MAAACARIDTAHARQATPRTMLSAAKLKDANWMVSTLFIRRWKKLHTDGFVVGGYLLEGHDLGGDVVSFAQEDM